MDSFVSLILQGLNQPAPAAAPAPAPIAAEHYPIDTAAPDQAKAAMDRAGPASRPPIPKHPAPHAHAPALQLGAMFAGVNGGVWGATENGTITPRRQFMSEGGSAMGQVRAGC